MSAGVFDSGAGGLTVLNELIRLNPETDFIYFADTAFLPYGEKPAQLLRERVAAVSRALASRGAEVLVAACGTASAVTQGDSPQGLRLFGAIEPTAKAAAQGKNVAVLCTRATAESGVFGKTIQKYNPEAVVTTMFSAKLVQYAENGIWDGDGLERELRRLISPVNEGDFDVFALGCTHFPLLLGRISALLRDGVRIVNIAEQTAKSVVNLRRESGRLEILCSGDPAEFARSAQRIIKGRSFTIEKFD